MRALIRQAASFLATPVSNVALVTDGTAVGDNIAGIYAGELEGAWSASVAQAYFLGQWERFSHVPLAVLAHSTHVKGAGTFDVATSTEHPRIEVKLASQISRDDCARLNLGYLDPGSVDVPGSDGAGAGGGGGGAGGGGGTLVVPRSGEMLTGSNRRRFERLARFTREKRVKLAPGAERE